MFDDSLNSPLKIGGVPSKMGRRYEIKFLPCLRGGGRRPEGLSSLRFARHN